MKKFKKIPVFKDEDEEDRFWSTHNLTDYYDVKKGVNVVFPNLKPSTQAMTVRMPSWLVNDLKVLANKRDVPYQSLMKVFLAEKVKAEFAA